MNTHIKSIQRLGWVACALAMLLGSPASAQWEGHFTGEIIEVDDSENRFQGVVQVGTAVSGHYTYGLPFGSDLILSVQLGTATLNSYDAAFAEAINDNWDGSDSFYLQAYTHCVFQWTPQWPDESEI